MKEHAPPHADPDAPELAVRKHHEPDGSLRETFESIVIAFVLAFIFRAFVVEAFVIPTGSMAPTLLGQHVSLSCPQCGYRFTVGPRDTWFDGGQDSYVARPLQGVWRQERKDRDGRRVVQESSDPLVAPCPMCDYEIRHRTLATDAGDRILVLKYIYAFREPRRWDVVVFKNPEKPEVNYIKRLVGLPGEQLWIVNGNIYTRPLDADGNPPGEGVPWRIERKTGRPDVQESVWRAVYHSDYYPLDHGDIGSESDRRHAWTVPWKPAQPDAWVRERGGRWRWAGQGSGQLRFDFDTNDHYAFNFHPYNLLEQQSGQPVFDGNGGKSVIGEMRLGATIMPMEKGLGVTLVCGGYHLFVRARIDAQGRAVIETAPRKGDGGPDPLTAWSERGAVDLGPLRVNRGTRAQLAHVDQSVSLWIDGRRIMAWEYDLSDITPITLQELAAGSEQRPPIAEIHVEGAPVVLRSVNLDRDLYYTQSGDRATGDSPALIPPDHFFCLGDNSPKSKDGRMWEEVDPWVTDVRDSPAGFVPRELMVGRAFFVYYPAAHPMPPSPLGVPNFGDMRFID